DDTYRPLVDRGLSDFPPVLLAGIDKALAVRPASRPQSIADWRSILRQGTPPRQDAAGGALRPQAPATPRMASAPVPPQRRLSPWLGAGFAVLALMAGGFAVISRLASPSTSLQSAQLEKAETERQKAEAELARLTADREAQRKAEEQKQQADVAARQAAMEEAQRKADAEAEA